MDDIDFNDLDELADDPEIVAMLDEVSGDLDICLKILTREMTTLKEIRNFIDNNHNVIEMAKEMAKISN